MSKDNKNKQETKISGVVPNIVLTPFDKKATKKGLTRSSAIRLAMELWTKNG